ncbi:MAG: hypothetical protein HGA45_36010, partial [Chloroflexales bacterium]|nr:hypothetical protein [Chloroflexales bacterium]
EGWRARALILAGAGLWLSALQRLMEGSPAGVAGWLRALGLLLVGALPLVGALGAWAGGALPDDLAGWLIPPVAYLAAAGALGGGVRLRG